MSQSLLRFITAGSVDDGKSTLIGRLLYDSKTLMNDQLASIDNGNDTPDFAALTDGLAAEREQGITIDVAYRYFATPKRKFIIADTPGHEQYTRNMVTGASTADAAIVLIDAKRVTFHTDGHVELLPQTKRHSALLRMLRCRHIIIAVNKLDLLDFAEDKYRAIVRSYQRIATTLGIDHFTAIPISALGGDNVVEKSANTPWYDGESLLTLLENLPLNTDDRTEQPFMFPVQRVARQDGSLHDDFRGYQGRIEQGRIRVGDAVRVEPHGYHSHISAIYTIDGATQQAVSGENITLTLADNLDISRGDMLVHADQGGKSDRNIHASLCWFDQVPLNTQRRYLLKHTTATVAAKVRSVDLLLDPKTLQHSKREDTLMQMNDIGRVRLTVQQPIIATTYDNNRKTGAFILIDSTSNQTVAAGMINATDNPDAESWVI